MQELDGSTPHQPTSYEEWGAEFFRAAVSEERVLGAVNGIAGQPIDVGPMGIGPGRIAKVRAYGAIGEAVATRLPGEQISYRVVLPADVTFELDLQVETQKFDAQLLVPITLSAVALSGVRIHIDARPPRSREIEVDVRAAGLRASVVQRVANVEGELRRFVAGYVRRELEKPHVRAARFIDVAGVIDKAWRSLPGHHRGETDRSDREAEE